MGRFEGRHTVEEAECTALLRAIQAAKALGYEKVIFEGDNQMVVNCIHSNSINLRLQHYINNIQSWRYAFYDLNFKHTPRSSNSCADILAKKAIRSNHQWRLFHSCPSFLLSNVNNDISN